MPCPGCGVGMWMMVVWIVFLVAIVAGAILLVRALWTRNAGARDTGSPEESEQRPDAFAILEDRFARGEIDRAEFEERRRMLRT